MRACWLTLCLLAVCVPSAHAHPYQLGDIRAVAAERWGATICGTSIGRIPIRFVALQGPVLAVAWKVDGSPNTRCEVHVDKRPWRAAKLCRVIVHEFGHLAGWMAAPGEEFVDGSGRVDPEHHRSRWHLMSAGLIPFWRPCARWRG